MRPLELKLRNFRSYGDETLTFDFRGRRLIGIVGPIGSGKTSILDGISFALYGRTPSLSRGTKSLIHQRADGCVVTFRFSVDDQVWEVVRALRKKGQSQHNLYRFDSDGLDAETVETVTLESDVNDKIIELLGLEFDAFSRSVLLAQGRFGEFLQAAPAQRDVVLKGLFGHERIDVMRQIAKQRVEALDLDLARGEQAAANVARLAEELVALKLEVESSTERLTLLEKASPAHTDDLEMAEGIRRELDALTERIQILGDLKRPTAGEVAELARKADEAEAARRSIAAEMETAELKWAEASAVLANLADRRSLTAEALVLVEDRRNRQVRIGEAQQSHATQTSRQSALQAEIAEAQERLDAEAVDDSEVVTARESLAMAEVQFHRSQMADMAGALRHDLADGDLCPVCSQVVDLTGISKEDAASIEDARGAVETAKESLGRLETQANERLAKRSRAQAQLEQLNKQLRETAADQKLAAKAVESEEKALAKVDKQLATLLGSGDAEAIALARQAEERQAEQGAEAARASRDAIRARHDRVIVAEQETSKTIGALEVSLAQMAGRLEVDMSSVAEKPAERITTMLKRLDEVLEGSGSLLEAQRKELEAIEGRIKSRLTDLSVEGTLDQAIGRTEARLNQQTAGAAGLEAQIAETQKALAGRDDQVAARDRFAQIVSDLSTAGFVRYLLDAEKQRLAELGSEHFQRLSAGRYRFATDDSFNVVDLTAADAIRKADSLSGGETFLASLGLALALAELVSRSGGRLDAFFLDEGFGSLDPEHLDLAMDGIEAVAAGETDRLVIVVSHVAELRERLEDLIQLERDPVSGNTRVLRA